MRLFDAKRVSGAVKESPGTILGLEEGRLLVAARGGRLAVGRLRMGPGKKIPAADAGLTAGERLS